MLDKKSFTVLNALRQTPGTSQRDIAASSGLSLGTVNAAMKATIKAGLVQDGTLTSAGLQALAPHKVENAVIMAAGLSSRFAPHLV